MSTLAEPVAFLVDGDPSPEQCAALDWCEAAEIDAETVLLADVAADAAALDSYDACWWHRAEPVEHVDELAACGETIESYLRGGGGLLLTLRALSAIEPLGVDPVSPDVSLVEEHSTTTGLLWKSRFEEHPAADGIAGLRIPTCTPHEPQPCARYERLLPERGEVLASTLRTDGESPKEIALTGWRVGDGDVAGLGTALRFDADIAEGAAENRARLLENLLGVLAAEDERLVAGRPKDAAELSRCRRRLASDRHRPRYHVSPPANWLNDPNGLIKRDGTYHAFYQYNPAGPHHGTIHWGHAVSEDLVTWEDRPVALTPSPDGPDRDGCWSGCAVDVDGAAKILYTGGRDDLQLPCLGTAIDDDLDGWEKADENPVVSSIPVEPPLRSTEHWRAEFRDHCIWREGDTWHHLIGSGVEDGGGTALLYTSEGDDLAEWLYRGPVLVGDPERDGDMWECPELLDLGDKQLLHISNYAEVRYYLGSYDADEGAFDVDRTGLLDHGEFYAPQSLWDDENGRWLTWGWVKEARDPEAQWDAGWSGTLSLPREIDLADDGSLRQRPAPELADLRESRVYGEAATLDDERRSIPIEGRAFEFEATVRIDDAEEFGLVVGESPDGEERTPIRYTRDSKLVVDRAHSSLDPRVTRAPVTMPVSPVDGPLSLRIFVDGSVLDVFANERHCLTTRFYPVREDSTGASVYAIDGRVTLDDLTVWTLGSAWEEHDQPERRDRREGRSTPE